MKAKLAAFGIHLAISALVLLIFLTITFFIWYPYPYFDIHGGRDILTILVTVDLVLGPLLTLVVFKPGKPGLKFDLSCIALAQIVALLYGGAVIFNQRPMVIAFVVDRFNVMSAKDVDLSRLKNEQLRNNEALHDLFRVGPVPVYVSMPEGEERENLMMSIILEGAPDMEYRSEYYEPYEPNIDQVLTRSAEFDRLPAETQQAVQDQLSEIGGSVEDYAYLPLLGTNKDALVMLSKENGRTVATLEVDPWAKKTDKVAASGNS